MLNEEKIEMSLNFLFLGRKLMLVPLTEGEIEDVYQIRSSKNN
jgi:hypothetical protein